MNRVTTPTAAKESAHTAARPPARTDDFTLLQQFCVKCDYDLRGLPEPCMCRECGEAAEAGMRFVPVRPPMSPLLATLVPGGFGLLMIAPALASVFAGSVSGIELTIALLGGALFLFMAAHAARNLWHNPDRGPAFLRLEAHGARFVHRANRVDIQWDDANVMSISRWGRATWRLSLRMRFQTLKLTAGEVTVQLRGTPRQIARVRAEILRRVNAARRESKVAESRVASVRGTR